MYNGGFISDKGNSYLVSHAFVNWDAGTDGNGTLCIRVEADPGYYLENLSDDFWLKIYTEDPAKQTPIPPGLVTILDANGRVQAWEASEASARSSERGCLLERTWSER